MEHVPKGEVLPQTVYGSLKPVDRFKNIATNLLETKGVRSSVTDMLRTHHAKWQSESTGMYYNLQMQNGKGWKSFDLSVYEKLTEAHYRHITSYNINDHMAGQAIMSHDGCEMIEYKDLDDQITEQMLQIVTEANPMYSEQQTKKAVSKRFWQLAGHYLISDIEVQDALRQPESLSSPDAKMNIVRIAMDNFQESLVLLGESTDSSYISKELEGSVRYSGVDRRYSRNIVYASQLYLRGQVEADGPA